MLMLYVEDDLPFKEDYICEGCNTSFDLINDVDALIIRSRPLTSELCCCPFCNKITEVKFENLE